MAQKLEIFIADLFHYTGEGAPMETVPLGLGYLSSYLMKRIPNKLDIHLFRNAHELMASMHDRRPTIVGFTLRMWNLELVSYCAKAIKSAYPETLIICGGPSVDSDPDSQILLWDDLNGTADYFVYGEGEVPFFNIINGWSGNGKLEPVEGSILFADGERVGGKIFDNRNSLEDIPSPILDGTLDRFMDEKLRPLIQTSRLCPYRCSFCSAGHQTGKLRVFSLQRISDELNYLARKYSDKPDLNLFIVDDNFGINKQDRDIADLLINSYKKHGYPLSMFCYFDKKFNDTTRHIAETLKEINVQGYPLPLQSLNKATMDAIQRINIPVETLVKMLAWSKEKKVHVGSELIFGLPKETKETFMEAIDFCVEKDIGVVIHTLMMFHGAAINRQSVRDTYKIKTKFRLPYVPSFTEIDGQYLTEIEEVAVSSDSFSFEDYKYIRIAGMLCYTMSGVGLCRRIMQFLVKRGIKPSYVWDRMIETIYLRKEFEAGEKFFSDFMEESINELFDNKEDAIRAVKKLGDKPQRLNTLFAARLIYHEDWLFDWFRQEFGERLGEDQVIFDDLLKICEMEWIDAFDPTRKIDLEISGKTAEYLSLPSNGGSNGSAKSTISLEPEEISVKKIEAMVNSLEHGPLFHYDLLTLMVQWEMLRNPVQLSLET